jgi:hypothetical protein
MVLSMILDQKKYPDLSYKMKKKKEIKEKVKYVSFWEFKKGN